MSLADIKKKKGTSCALIQEGFKKIETSDLIGKEVTIINVDTINLKTGMCGVIAFKEFPEAFYFAGKVLTDLCVDILADDEAYNEMIDTGVKIKIFESKSESTGRKYTTFNFV